MTKFLFFNFFKAKSFKVISLTLALFFTSSFAVVTNHQFNTNTINASNKLSGFHITVKENNKNLIDEAATWNSINNRYQDFISNNNNARLITEFDDWSDIINQVNILPSDDKFSKDINDQFKKQITVNDILPSNDQQYFTNTIIGRSVAKQSLNDITSFGDVYVGYHDSLSTHINNGLFATISPKTDFDNYFSIPYMIKPSDKFFTTHSDIQNRLTVMSLNNSNLNDPNQPMVVILAKKNNAEQLLINNKVDGVINSDKINYALLSHKPSDGLKPTNFTITVKNSSYSKNLSLTNNSSNIQFLANKVDTTYLVKNSLQDNKKTLIVMNEVAKNVKIKNINEQQKWLIWSVDSQTLQKRKNDRGRVISKDESLSIKEGSDFQVYLVALQTTDHQQQAASEQYITIYKNNTKLPTFLNCTNFLQENNDLIAGFQQYLTAATSVNNNIKVEDLKNNAGELLSWFIYYQGDIFKQNYINYLQSNDANNPWNVDVTLLTKTLVNHWNIIIICGLIFILLIVIPIVIVVIRKKKYLK